MTVYSGPFRVPALLLVLAAGSPSAQAQGVPIIDGSRLANAMSRIAEQKRDAGNQDQMWEQSREMNGLIRDEVAAYERFLENTTGRTDLSDFEEGGTNWSSAAETYPVTETHPDADRLFGENQDVERMIIVTAQKYQNHPGVAAAGLNPLTWRILFQSLVKQESRFNNAAVSSAGAMGFAQLMPGTAEDLGVDHRDRRLITNSGRDQ